MDFEAGQICAEIIAKAIKESAGISARTEFANSVEISNANSKGELHVTVKGRSDGDLKALVEECVKQFKEAKTTGGAS